jgi:hypothetical protein
MSTDPTPWSLATIPPKKPSFHIFRGAIGYRVRLLAAPFFEKPHIPPQKDAEEEGIPKETTKTSSPGQA